MASGTLTSLNALSGTTFSLTFTPAATWVSGTLQAQRLDTGALTEQAVVSGLNSVTVVPGRSYLFVVASLDVLGAFIGMSNPVTVAIPQTGEGSDWKVRWKSDFDTSWTQYGFDIDEVRVRVPLLFSGSRGHHMQFEFINDGQNDRMVVRNLAIEARLHGKSMAARQGIS